MAAAYPAPFEDRDQLLELLEEKQRTVLSAMDQVLSMGDFQKHVDQPIAPQELIATAAQNINEIIQFNASAIYLVNQETSDLELSCCIPAGLEKELGSRFENLVERGHIAWALKERRGIIVYSHDRRYRVLLHPMATYARIRAIFIGLLPLSGHRLPDGSLQALSLVLRNAANTLESLEYLTLFQRQNAELQTKVDQKVGELRRLDHQLYNARKMDAIATLAGGVAHQFNNALSILVGNVDLIQLDIANTRDPKASFERMKSVAQRMQDLTAKLVAYARGGKYKPETVYIETLVQNALKEVRGQTPNLVDINSELSVGTYSICVDVTQMHLVLSAILTNAVEALEAGGTIDISAEQLTIEPDAPPSPLDLAPGRYLALQIKDNGRGMDETTQQQIFDPFFTTKFMGRGLSMAAVYGIVKSHHGEITVESELGRGTTVRVYLPLAD